MLQDTLWKFWVSPRRGKPDSASVACERQAFLPGGRREGRLSGSVWFPGQPAAAPLPPGTRDPPLGRGRGRSARRGRPAHARRRLSFCLRMPNDPEKNTDHDIKRPWQRNRDYCDTRFCTSKGIPVIYTWIEIPRPALPGQARRGSGAQVFSGSMNTRGSPPLINHMPVEIQRAHMGMGVRSGFSPQRASRNSYLPSGQKKFPTNELHDIQGELRQIKAQVDSLLQSLERVDWQQVSPAATKDSGKNRGPGSKGSSGSSEPPQKPWSEGAGPEADGYEGGTDTEWTVENHAEDQDSQEAAGTPPGSSAPGILG
ncbi:uncharacterized protein LOC129015180 [Pongo pygmaeus]|uniref:uncharacterized protein LOC129015180 n=1 Tax=Pongo pygmaeus TaxID=9600 RepID=UPI00300D458A